MKTIAPLSSKNLRTSRIFHLYRTFVSFRVSKVSKTALNFSHKYFIDRISQSPIEKPRWLTVSSIYFTLFLENEVFSRASDGVDDDLLPAIVV